MAPTLTASSTEVLAGLVDRVTFHNSDNGFCVLRVKARGQRDLITLVGHAAMISAGEFVQTSGSRINDRTHGVQFKAAFLKAAAPTTVEGIEKYLGSGMIRGIGPVYAKKRAGTIASAADDLSPPPQLCSSSSAFLGG
jgi:exodeoxyribonuclease V alpha subunit